MMFDKVGKDFALQVGIYKSQVGLKFKLVRIRSETIGNLRGQAMMRIFTNAGGIPSTIHVSGKPEVSYVPAYNLYYGTPIYDLRIPLNPIYPVLTPSHPGVPPVLPPTTTQQPFDDDDYDGIEKLDAKVDPATETKKPGNSEQDDDSITVEAI
ncbi:hypothetical protein RF55_6807 [Lasius niger]|uniref:Uncharacterized protein n=1 Tax=Lasius niger TaxID=67767 RepID=A0A0J7KS07_LASNI|nr:hypothetical protein RF55_6807 [Lasius niger]